MTRVLQEIYLLKKNIKRFEYSFKEYVIALISVGAGLLARVSTGFA